MFWPFLCPIQDVTPRCPAADRRLVVRLAADRLETHSPSTAFSFNLPLSAFNLRLSAPVRCHVGLLRLASYRIEALLLNDILLLHGIGQQEAAAGLSPMSMAVDCTAPCWKFYIKSNPCYPTDLYCCTAF